MSVDNKAILSKLQKSQVYFYIAQFIIFILYSIVLLERDMPPHFEIGSLIIIFTIAVGLNIRLFTNSNAVISFVFKTFKEDQHLISEIIFAAILFDSKGNIVRYKLNESIEHIVLGNNLLSELLRYFKVPYQVRKEIKHAIKTKDGEKFEQYFGNYEVGGTIFDIALKRLDARSAEVKMLYITYASHKFSKIYSMQNKYIGFYEANETFKITNCNEYFAKILGYKTNELMRRNFRIKDLMVEKEFAETFTAKGHMQHFVHFNTKHNEKITCFVSQKSLQNAQGVVEKRVGFVLRIQNTSLMQSNFAAENWIDYLWSTFFEKLPYPVLFLDSDGIILKINIFAVEAFSKRVIKKPITSLFKEQHKLDIENKFATIGEDKYAAHSILNLLSTDPIERTLNLLFHRVYDFESVHIGYLARISDVTSQQELEQTLSHAQRMQTAGQLVGAVAHDFNNLLTAIGGFCEILLQRHSIGDQSFVNIMQIKQSSDRASNLVHRLLAFSRKQTFKLRALNLREFFSEISTLIQRLLGGEIILKKDIALNLWQVKFDPVQMEQVVLNLTMNSKQAMERNGVLNISIQNIALTNNPQVLRGFVTPSGEPNPSSGDYVMMSFTDNGGGIQKQIIQRIFEPFFTTKSEKSGTGLVLSTVYGIVRQSGGYIYVKSEVGVGTTFLILLQRIDEEEAIILNEENIEQNNLKENEVDLFGKGSILLIEDEEAVRIFAKSALTSKGYEVVEFESAKSAINQIEKYLPTTDLIISDVVMPEMTGPEFVAEVRKRRPDVKVLFMSGYGEDVFTEEYGDKRDFQFIAKPFSLKQLVIKVKTLL